MTMRIATCVLSYLGCWSMSNVAPYAAMCSLLSLRDAHSPICGPLSSDRRRKANDPAGTRASTGHDGGRWITIYAARGEYGDPEERDDVDAHPMKRNCHRRASKR